MDNTNARIMASIAIVDGARFLFRGVEVDRFQQLWDRIWTMAVQSCDGDERTAERYCKLKVLKHDDGKGGSLRSVAVYGPACREFFTLPWHLVDALAELQVKCYLVERFPGAHDAMVDGLYSNVARVAANLSFYGNRPRQGNAKSSGNKGVRVGSRKSDKHAVAYKKSKERTGVESRVKDRTLKRCISSTKDVIETLGSTALPNEKWRLLKMKVGVVGFAHFLNALAEAGVVITDFFSHAGPYKDEDAPYGAILVGGRTIAQQQLNLP